MAYIPDPNDVTQPTGSVSAQTAAAEFRSLKAKIAEILGSLVQWNTQDVSAFANLLGGNLIVNTPSSTPAAPPYQYVRANTGKSSGKWYFELTFTSVTGNVRFGLASAFSPIVDDDLGTDFYSVGVDVATRYKYTNNVGAPFLSTTISNGDTLGIGFDLDTGILRVVRSGVTTQAAVASFTSGFVFFPAITMTAAGTTIIANFGASRFVYNPPADHLPLYSLAYTYSENPNILVNGSALVDQHNAGATVNPIVSGNHIVDCWKYEGSVAAKFKAGQDINAAAPPTGYSNYFGAEVIAGYAPAAGEYFSVVQNVEGYSIAKLLYGSSSAVQTTLSFYAQSNTPGTYGLVITNPAGTRALGLEYEITLANTWELINIQLSGDATGTWTALEETTGLILRFDLGSNSNVRMAAGQWGAPAFVPRGVTGSVSIVATLGHRLYLTGVEFRRGLFTSTQPRELVKYNEVLAQCQRYFFKTLTAKQLTGYAGGAAIAAARILSFPVPMRIVPTVSATFSGGVNVAASGVQAISLVDCELYTTSAAAGDTLAIYDAGNTINATL